MRVCCEELEPVPLVSTLFSVFSVDSVMMSSQRSAARLPSYHTEANEPTPVAWQPPSTDPPVTDPELEQADLAGPGPVGTSECVFTVDQLIIPRRGV